MNRLGVALAIGLGGCAPKPPPSPAVPSPPVAPAAPAIDAAIPVDASVAPAPAPTPASPTMNEHNWIIRAGGVGDLVIGQPLPESLRSDDLAARYFARYVADGQPFEGFRFDAPSLTVAIAGGPFARAHHLEPTAPHLAKLRAQAASLAKAGAPAGVTIRAILVTAAGPTTEAGVGVGSPLAAVKAAYPDLVTHPVPPTLGKDECVGGTKALRGVRFIFPSCKAAAQGQPVSRIDVWPLPGE